MEGSIRRTSRILQPRSKRLSALSNSSKGDRLIFDIYSKVNSEVSINSLRRSVITTATYGLSRVPLAGFFFEDNRVGVRLPNFLSTNFELIINETLNALGVDHIRYLHETVTSLGPAKNGEYARNVGVFLGASFFKKRIRSHSSGKFN